MQHKSRSPLISIIAPVYKVERYLNQCIDSVLRQEFTDWEMILVDDGSPDDCGKICDCYAKADSRITVIHKSNGGLSSARNAGMEKASGHYLFFLDSDDYLPDNALLHLTEAACSMGYPEYIKGNHRVLMPSGAEVTTRFAICRQFAENQVISGGGLFEFDTVAPSLGLEWSDLPGFHSAA